ncbi:MAG: hypothetical protein IIB61_01255 [Planctomycetes bacterium]|nr:hypothetical protein [Planctomycetota bacterium]
MWLMILLLLFLVAVTMFQGMQGLFSAFVMMVLTLCCAAISLGTYESVAVEWLSGWRPDFAFAIAIAATFGVPLLLLRLAFDRVIRRSCLLPSVVDRIGGSLCGLVTGFIITGFVATSLQMVPFGESVVGYTRFAPARFEHVDGQRDPDPPDPDEPESELFLKPDKVALLVGGLLSDGIFSGERSFSYYNPDVVQAAAWGNTVPRAVSRYAPPNSIKISRTERLDYVYEFTKAERRRRFRDPNITDPEDTYEQKLPKDEHGFYMVAVELTDAARDKTKSHRFVLRQFRLVGTNPPQPGELHRTGYQQYHPIAIRAEDEEHDDRHIRYMNRGSAENPRVWPVIDTIYLPVKRTDDDDKPLPPEVEIVFELPEGFTPEYLEYKQAARAAVTFADDEDDDDVAYDDGRGSAGSSARASSGARTAAPSTPVRTASSEDRSSETRSRRGRGGRVRGKAVRVGASHFGDDFVIEMTAYTGRGTEEISRGKMASGHLVGRVDEQKGGSDVPVAKFDVPSDKRLLHLNVKHLQARSSFGKALSFAVRTMQNYLVQDTDGRRYRMVGKYAIADVNGEEIIEVQYFKDQVGSIGGVGKFRRIKNSNLKGDYELVLLFLVEPGVQIDSFTTGGSASRRDDLRGENLVAPD